MSPTRMGRMMEEINSYEKYANAHAAFKELRRTSPIRFDASRGAWEFFTYRDCNRILKDPYAFSSGGDRIGTGRPDIMNQDPPDHKMWRDLSEHMFKPRHMRALSPSLSKVVDELIDKVLHQGSMHLVRDLGLVMPTIAIANLLGIEHADWNQLRQWTLDVLAVPTDANGVFTSDEAVIQETLQRKNRSVIEFNEFMRERVEERKQNPKEDLLSMMWRHNEEQKAKGEKSLSEEDLTHHGVFLFAGGSDTSIALITNGVKILCDRPELQDQLAADPSLIPSFVEEVLRYESNVVAIPRTATREVEIEGHVIKAGQPVISYVLSANRDEEQFSDPDQFVVDRKPNAHLAFSMGPHFCLGAPLARLEGLVVFETIIKRLRNIRMVEGAEYRRVSFPNWGWEEFPVHFEAR